MNYKHIYKSIIDNRIKNELSKSHDVYTELHHIIPKSLGGTNDKSNLVRLTSREHFICHCLLAKMYKNDTTQWYKMNNAINAMGMTNESTNSRYFNSRLYESLKSKYWGQQRLIHQQFGLKQINEICNWMDINNKKPNRKSKDNYEKKLGDKLDRLRQSKKGKGKTIFHKSYDDLVVKLGYPNLFTIYNNEEKISMICDFIDKNNKKPNEKSKNNIERTLGKKLSGLRQSKKGKGNTIFHKSYDDLVVKLGYPNLFTTYNNEELNLEKISMICDFIDKNNKKPSEKSKNNIERTLGKKLSGLRQSKSENKNCTVFLESYQQLVNKRGYPNLFKIILDK